MKKKLSFVLNDRKITLEIAAQEVLLEVLRDKLGVKSPKCGCDRGDCGTCTVLMNGKTIRSCMVLAVEADGQRLTTIEGLMKNGQMTPVQQSFLEHNSFQCGFCAPGVILAATELLERNPKPSGDEIKEAISGNLCRCTGYLPIVAAIANVNNALTPPGRERLGKKVRS